MKKKVNVDMKKGCQIQNKIIMQKLMKKRLRWSHLSLFLKKSIILGLKQDY